MQTNDMHYRIKRNILVIGHIKDELKNIFVTIINKLWSILHSMKLSELDIVSY